MDPRDNVRKTFDLLAKDYARLRRSGFDETLRLVSGGDFKSICDAGSGPGTYGQLFAGASQTVIQLDLSREMVDIGWRKDSAEGIGWKVHCLVCDVSSLPIRDDSLDLTVSIAVVHHLPKALASHALRELLRITSTSGTVFLSVWSPEAMDKAHGEVISEDMSVVWWKTQRGSVARQYWRWKPTDLRDACTSCGFQYFDTFVSGRNIFVLATKV